MPVVVVESPAKAKTINKYLGSGYTVLASFGHVRDLPPKDGSVDTQNDFEMKWEVDADSRKRIREIAAALKDDNALVLATDPDREGEAISWHLREALIGAKAIGESTPVQRVVFNAITKSAVTEAMQSPRDVDSDLVHAYLARRALDYLVGFNLSPVLWRKLPGARSAGRVQSVCLRLIVEREMEIEAFDPKEYWSVTATLATPRGAEFQAQLTSMGGKKLDRFGLDSAEVAELAVTAVGKRDLAALSVDARPERRNPSPPFMTSTLQQEASRKLGFGARETMSLAQRLYEAGLITYMRTDGIDMAPEAVEAAREEIRGRFGGEYVPGAPRLYKNKAKNAQEAHECIRPTEMDRDAGAIKVSDDGQRRLYELIWKRTLACQMESARVERTTVEIGSADGQVTLTASGQVVLFDGFTRVYTEGRDEAGKESGDDRKLPQIDAGDPMRKLGVVPEQHFTKAPPRYSEATLVKKMEEIGIGRPSTYASIVTTIQDRDYVAKEKRNLVPTAKGRLVTSFLVNFFRKYVGYEFTANLEEELDVISAGKASYKDVLSRFWGDFSTAIEETSQLRISQVLDTLDAALAPLLYPEREDGADPRTCPQCGKPSLHLKVSRNGGFLGCSNYPDCRFARSLGAEGEAVQERVLGEDNGDEISLRTGRFGPYVQRGEAAEGEKPPRASLPKDWPTADLDLERAVMLLSLPREVGAHPEDGEAVLAGIGRYGPYVRHGNVYANLESVEEVFSVGMNRAVEVLAQKLAQRGRGRGRGAAQPPLKELGSHPELGGAVNVMDGRYGPYVKWERINATLPKDVAPEDVTMEMAVELIQARADKKGAKLKKPGAKAAAKPRAKAKPKPKAKAPGKPRARAAAGGK